MKNCKPVEKTYFFQGNTKLFFFPVFCVCLFFGYDVRAQSPAGTNLQEAIQYSTKDLMRLAHFDSEVYVSEVLKNQMAGMFSDATGGTFALGASRMLGTALAESAAEKASEQLKVYKESYKRVLRSVEYVNAADFDLERAIEKSAQRSADDLREYAIKRAALIYREIKKNRKESIGYWKSMFDQRREFDEKKKALFWQAWRKVAAGGGSSNRSAVEDGKKYLIENVKKSFDAYEWNDLISYEYQDVNPVLRSFDEMFFFDRVLDEFDQFLKDNPVIEGSSKTEKAAKDVSSAGNVPEIAENNATREK